MLYTLTMTEQSKTAIDLLPHVLQEHNAARRVIDSYFDGHQPPIFADRGIGEFDPKSMAETFACSMSELYRRVRIGLDATWDLTEGDTIEEWEKKRTELVCHLEQAAANLNDGRDTADSENANASTLLKMARLYRLLTIESIYPAARSCRPQFIPRTELVGRSGGAAKPEAATRGLMIRWVAQYVPESIETRYATICQLINTLGIDSHRHLVRSLLKGGRT